QGTLGDGLAKFGLETLAVVIFDVHVLVEKLALRLALGLGLVEGKVGLGHEDAEVVLVLLRADGADADRDADMLAQQIEGRTEGSQHGLGVVDDLLSRLGVAAIGNELVAPEAGDNAARTERLAD